MGQLPIGVMDSGVGGLSVLRHIREILPHEHLIYVADSAHAPYGTKTQDAIQMRSKYLADFLLAHGAKALVVACNTATAAAAAMLRQYVQVPVIAMEPAVKPAVAATKSGVVGVLATSGTLKSAQFAALLEAFGQGVQVVTQAGHGLVECVEQGALDAPATRDLLWTYLKPLCQAGADTLVLGCTHYPFLRPVIDNLVEGRMTVIDTGAAVARQLCRRLEESKLLSVSTLPGDEQFWSSGELSQSREVMSQLWGAVVQVNAVR